MAKILIIGGHGKVALLAEPLLVEAGHTVTAVIRNPDQATEVEATGAAAVVSDIETLDEAHTDALVAGHDVVVWSAGAGGGDPHRTHAVDHDAAMRVLRAVQAIGSRLLMVSYFGSSLDHGVASDDAFHAYAEAKGSVDAAIRASGTDWVILAPSTLTTEEEGGVDLDPDVTATTAGRVEAGRIARATVARLIAEVVARPSLRRVTLRVNDGDVPVAEALDRLG